MEKKRNIYKKLESEALNDKDKFYRNELYNISIL